MPRHSACEEVWDGAGLLLDLAASQAAPGDPLYGVVATSSLSEALERLYRDRSFLMDRSRAAFEHATAPRFSWRRIAERWGEIFAEVLS